MFKVVVYCDAEIVHIYEQRCNSIANALKRALSFFY